jgi:hypothetical protein
VAVARRERPGEQAGPPDPERPHLSRRDVWRLILATYRATLPLFLVVLLGLILATWIVTTLLF